MMITWGERNDLQRDYLCASCWGLLDSETIELEDKIRYRVFCRECGNQDGFVSHQFVTWMQERSLRNYYIAKDALREAVPWMFPGRPVPTSESEILRELGY